MPHFLTSVSSSWICLCCSCPLPTLPLSLEVPLPSPHTWELPCSSKAVWKQTGKRPSSDGGLPKQNSTPIGTAPRPASKDQYFIWSCQQLGDVELKSIYSRIAGEETKAQAGEAAYSDRVPKNTCWRVLPLLMFWARSLFIVGDCSAHCRVLSSILGLNPPDVSSTSPDVTVRNVPTHCQLSPGGQALPSGEPLLLGVKL